ncbi:hydrolase, NUDIX family [Aeromicrobium marinum DSM 15272]|uniref:Hydrolase, NUDIX family n=1 Tax=Aeromicrobium marinum DSM 15272 TaxID=585531 RepID=E2SCW1_9ACTN|nr:NUDIX domain-containing protein [Aeromicrobium marinum]EFQ83064.1 hydrolase, NUDIX family [Aeromicrobium marinum DSM 15272]
MSTDVLAGPVPATDHVTVAVSTVIFALRPHPTTGVSTLWLPLVRRIREPYEGQWALPGGPLESDEDLVTSARRTLERTTGLDPRHLEQLYSFGAVDRSRAGDEQQCRDRVVSIVYWALVRAEEAERAVNGQNVRWFVADEVPELAFDHNAIVRYALARLRSKITYSPIAHAFLDDEFTLAQLRAVHEGVLLRPLDPANFRRQVLASSSVEPTGQFLTGTSHRPPALYRSLSRPTHQPEEQA